MYKKSAKSLLLGVVVVVLAVVVILPIVWVAFMAFRPENIMFYAPWEVPLSFTVKNFVEKTFNSEFLRSIYNSMEIGLVTAIVTVALGVPASFALARGKLRGKKLTMLGIMMLRMAPPGGYAIVMYLIMSKCKLIDTLAGISAAYMTATLPLVIWLVTMFMQDIPASLFEAAEVDGATLFRVMTKIALPLTAPGIFAAFVMAFNACWIDFFFALLFTRQRMKPATISVMNFLGYASYDWGGISAACIVLIIPAIPISYFMQKYLASGLMSGSVKG